MTRQPRTRTARFAEPCFFPTGPARTCGAVPTREYIQGAFCIEHTPNRVKGLPETPEGTCAPSRCYCGKPSCPAYETFDQPDRYAAAGGAAWAAVDARAVASGKRRAGTGTQAAARATVAEQRARDAALRHPDRPERPETTT